jgi:hypothetical protein
MIAFVESIGGTEPPAHASAPNDVKAAIEIPFRPRIAYAA